MNRIPSSLILILLGGILMFANACKDKNVKPDSNTELTTEIDRICDSVLANSSLPGMVVGIWSGEKSFSYLKGKGYSNLARQEAMQPLSPFRIGSNTKSFVVTIILQLAEEGKLSLDDKLSKYMPDYPRADEVTLRMLGNMTSGIPNYTATDTFGKVLDQTPLKHWEPEELVAIAKQHDYLFTPGTQMSYSNTNTVILGIIAEQLTGMSLADNIKMRISDKLGLTTVVLASDQHMSPGGISGYANFTDSTQYTDDVTEYYNVSWAWAAGGIIASVMDTKSWVEHLIGGSLLSAGMQEQRFIGNGIPGSSAVYGQGIFTYGNDMWGHNGGLPGYTSIMMHHKTKDITFVIFYNWQHPSITPDQLYLRLLKVVHPEL